MSHKSKGIALAAAIMASVASFGSTAGVLFQDGLESGNRSASTNGVRLTDSTDSVSVSTALAATGKYSLEFLFDGVPMGEDSFAEQRLSLGAQRTEVWVKFDLYIPSNYNHRNDSPTNNKFFAIYSAPYGTPGFQVNFSTSASSGDSSIGIHYYKNGAEQSSDGMPTAKLFSSGDKGKWHRIVMHFKVPTSSSSSDGVMELWKDGAQLISTKTLASNGTSGKNYMDEAYILGWANSGFDQDTKLYVDDLVVSDTAISAAGSAITVNPPSAPTLNVTK